MTEAPSSVASRRNCARQAASASSFGDRETALLEPAVEGHLRLRRLDRPRHPARPRISSSISWRIGSVQSALLLAAAAGSISLGSRAVRRPQPRPGRPSERKRRASSRPFSASQFGQHLGRAPDSASVKVGAGGQAVPGSIPGKMPSIAGVASGSSDSPGKEQVLERRRILGTVSGTGGEARRPGSRRRQGGKASSGRSSWAPRLLAIPASLRVKGFAAPIEASAGSPGAQGCFAPSTVGRWPSGRRRNGRRAGISRSLCRQAVSAAPFAIDDGHLHVVAQAACVVAVGDRPVHGLRAGCGRLRTRVPQNFSAQWRFCRSTT